MHACTRSPGRAYTPEIAAPVLGGSAPRLSQHLASPAAARATGAGLSHGETESSGHEQEMPFLDFQFTAEQVTSEIQLRVFSSSPRGWSRLALRRNIPLGNFADSLLGASLTCSALGMFISRMQMGKFCRVFCSRLCGLIRETVCFSNQIPCSRGAIPRTNGRGHPASGCGAAPPDALRKCPQPPLHSRFNEVALQQMTRY